MVKRLRQALWTRRIWWVLLPGALIFFSPYVVLLLDRLFRLTGGNNLPPVPGALLAGVTVPFVMTMFADTVLFSQALSYVLLSLLVLAVCGGILLRSRVGRAARVTSGLTALSVLAVPLVFQMTPDSTWLNAHGFEVRAIPTRQTFVDDTVDGLVNLLDGKACQHEILGWSADNQLYYETHCTFTPPTFWRFDPAGTDPAQQIAAVTDTLVTPPETLLMAGYPEGYPPADYRSPDGRWIASVWGDDFYGPEHVMVLTERI